MQNYHKGAKMSEQMQRPRYFNSLKADGDTAVVRILHTTVSSIEVETTHRITVDGKTKRIKCIGEGCPLCFNLNPQEPRIYVHLWNYTNGQEEVWDRTDKLIPQLTKLQESWNPLYSAVVKITRKGNEFPTYTLEPQNPMQYDSMDIYKDKVDKSFSKLFSLSRKKEEIEEYLKTGKFPEKKPYIPKDQYKAMKQKEKEAVKTEEPVSPPSDSLNDYYDPFGDITRPTKV